MAESRPIEDHALRRTLVSSEVQEPVLPYSPCDDDRAASELAPLCSTYRSLPACESASTSEPPPDHHRCELYGSVPGGSRTRVLALGKPRSLH